MEGLLGAGLGSGVLEGGDRASFVGTACMPPVEGGNGAGIVTQWVQLSRKGMGAWRHGHTLGHHQCPGAHAGPAIEGTTGLMTELPKPTSCFFYGGG
jgi:hypothetical protein